MLWSQALMHLIEPLLIQGCNKWCICLWKYILLLVHPAWNNFMFLLLRFQMQLCPILRPWSNNHLVQRMMKKGTCYAALRAVSKQQVSVCVLRLGEWPYQPVHCTITTISHPLSCSQPRGLSGLGSNKFFVSKRVQNCSVQAVFTSWALRTSISS